MFNGSQDPHAPNNPMAVGTKRTRDSSDEEDAENFQPPSKRSSLEFGTPPVGPGARTVELRARPTALCHRSALRRPFPFPQPFNQLQNYPFQFPLANDWTAQNLPHYQPPQQPMYNAFPPVGFAADSGNGSDLLHSSTGSSGMLNASVGAPHPAGSDVFMKKYDITIAEVIRRTRQPENLNTSLLGGVLRKAKNKGGGDKLREELSARGINLPSGRRRALQSTSFTALCEAEAAKLAEDFRGALFKYFPAEALLWEVARVIVQRETEWAQKYAQALEVNGEKDEMEAAVDLLTAAFGVAAEVLERDRSLVAMGVESDELHINQPLLPSELQSGLEQFNLITHNFGVRAVRYVFAAMVGSSSDGQSSSSGFDDDEEDSRSSVN
ncbi:Transcription factor AP-2 [Aphelenchoides fujianensis]|nr:Transcription factor AP-2 [Aphelenchoides fujianensis]